MSEPTMDTARIAEKVRRLLALATSSNEHEAAAAAAKAQELLHRYNLSMAEVSASSSDKPAGVTYERIMVDIGNSASWRGVLLGSVARHNGADVISLGGGRYAVIGEAHVVEVCRYLYEYLAREIDRFADRGWLNFHGYESSSRRWKTGFRFGAISTIDQRLAAQRKQQGAESEQSRALIVVNDEALKRAVARYYPRLTTRGSGRISGSGYNAGAAAGHGIGLNAALTGSGNRQRLLS